MSSDKLTVKVEAFKPMRSHSLFGFADLLIPEMRLRIKECPILASHGRKWVSLPGKPQIDENGAAIRDDRGKVQYINILQFTDRATSDRFSERVIEALLASHPHAFDPEN